MVASTPIMILDGGLGTTLEDSYGVSFSSETTPLWSSHLLLTESGVNTLRNCQSSFIRSGAEVVLTATYQTSIAGFVASGKANGQSGMSLSDISRHLDQAISIAEDAAATPTGDVKRPGNAQVALSLGPYGACMIPSQEYNGKYDTEHAGEKELCAWHSERLRLFDMIPKVIDRVQYVAFETLPRRDEILAVRKAFVSSVLRNHRFWISCVYPGDGEALPDGTNIQEVVDAMLDPGVTGVVPWGIGINCTKIGKLASIVDAYERTALSFAERHKVSSFPALILYPDGTNGEVYDTSTQKWTSLKAEMAQELPWEKQLAQIVQQSQSRGIWSTIVVGGCCKARPEDIYKLSAEIKQL